MVTAFDYERLSKSIASLSVEAVDDVGCGVLCGGDVSVIDGGTRRNGQTKTNMEVKTTVSLLARRTEATDDGEEKTK